MNTVIFGLVAVPMIIGLVTVFVKAGLPTHFAPLLDLLFGIGLGFAAIASKGIPPGDPWVQSAEAIVVGLGLGLTASGVYQVPGQYVKLKEALTSAPPAG